MLLAKLLMLLLCFRVVLLLNQDNRGESNTGAAIGIDFGAAHVRVAVFRDGRPKVLKNEQGSELTPAFVAFTSNGHRLVGDEAKSQLVSNPENTVFSLFPFLGGRDFDDEAVQNHTETVPYAIFSSHNKVAVDIKIGDRTESFSAEELVAMLLSKMKDVAEKYLNEHVTSAIISVSSCLTYSQRRAMRDAGKISGFQEVRIVNAHMTTALAYLFKVEMFSPKRVLIVDAGAASLGVAVMSVGNGAIRTLAQGCTNSIGGDVFQQRMASYLERLYETKNGRSMAQRLRSKKCQAQQKLRKEVEKAVRTLSFKEFSDIEVDALFNCADFSEVLMQSRFEELNMDLFKSSVDLAEQVVNRAGPKSVKIDDIILVGGSSRIVKLRALFENAFYESQLSEVVDPDTSSAIGAAVWAGNLGERAFDDGTIGAFKPGLLSSGNFALVDSTSNCLGYRAKRGYFSKVISQSEPLPAKGELKVSLPDNYDDELSHATLTVFEGEQLLAVSKNLLGAVQVYFKLTAVPALWASFVVNNEHVVKVTLREMKAGTVNSAIFDHRLEIQEMRRMSNRLQTFTDRDRWEAKRIEARDDLESLAYQMRRRLGEDRPAERGSSELERGAQRAAQRAIDWLETHGSDADAGEFIQKKRELVLAGQRTEL